MATRKSYVMTYLNSRTYHCLVEFKQDNELRSLSSAIELILGQYFGIAPQLPTTDDSQALGQFGQRAAITSSLVQCRQLLQTSINQLNAVPDWIQNTAVTLGEIEQNLTIESSQTSEDVVRERSTADVHTLFCDYTIKRGITGTALAKRLNTWSSEISRRRVKPGFETWSRSLDPNQVGWEYRGTTRRFHPV